MIARPIRRINYTIQDGDAGIYETMDYMWHYALRDASEPLIQRLVISLQGRNDLETIKNIFNWVWRNVRYKPDPSDYEMVTSPIHYVNGNRDTGDCDCMTTLLVCLLEASGFDSAIKVIAWREYSYTHVFAEVWYNNDWQILDPTLKQNGFGRQDKEIIREKRKTKKDMAKLQVLSDSRRADTQSVINTHPPFMDAEQGGISSAMGGIDLNKRRISNRNRCCGRNDNANNININFGTNIENSHNRDGGGRVLDYNLLPQLENIYTHYKPQSIQRSDAITLPSTEILKHNNITENYAPAYRTENNIGAMNKRVVLNNKRPKYVPNVVRNYYPEFP